MFGTFSWPELLKHHPETLQKCIIQYTDDHKNNYLLFIDSYFCKQIMFCFLFFKDSVVERPTEQDVNFPIDMNKLHPHNICKMFGVWGVFLSNINV